jgi:hypothetical protein
VKNYNTIFVLVGDDIEANRIVARAYLCRPQAGDAGAADQPVGDITQRILMLVDEAKRQRIVTEGWRPVSSCCSRCLLSGIISFLGLLAL